MVLYVCIVCTYIQLVTGHHQSIGQTVIQWYCMYAPYCVYLQSSSIEQLCIQSSSYRIFASSLAATWPRSTLRRSVRLLRRPQLALPEDGSIKLCLTHLRASAIVASSLLWARLHSLWGLNPPVWASPPDQLRSVLYAVWSMGLLYVIK